MSRHVINLTDGRELRYGTDRPFKTLYVQLWDNEFDRDWDGGAPAKAAGYHPMERVEPLAGEYGPYPIANVWDLDGVLIDWGVAGDIREQVGRGIAQDALDGITI